MYAADGEVGLVAGLVIDRRDHQVTQVLVRHGHLRGRKDVAVPVSAVTGIRDVIRLSLTGDQVRALRPAQT